MGLHIFNKELLSVDSLNAAKIINNGDADQITGTHMYIFAAGSKNLPFENRDALLINLSFTGDGSKHLVQLALPDSDLTVSAPYCRHKYGAKWSDWKSLGGVIKSLYSKLLNRFSLRKAVA